MQEDKEDMDFGLEKFWEGKKVVAYAPTVFDKDMGQYVMVHFIGARWVVVETLKSDKTPTGDIYLIPSVHIFFKSRNK